MPINPMEDLFPEQNLYQAETQADLFGDQLVGLEDLGDAEESPSIPNEALENLGRYIGDLYNQYSASTVFQDALTLAKESRDYYDVKPEATDFPWPNASNIKTPLTRIAVDETEPRLVAAVVSPDPIVSMKALPNPQYQLSEEDMRMFGKQVQEYFEIELKHTTKIEDWTPTVINNLLLDGTAYELVSWEVETRRVKEITFDPATQQPILVPKNPGDPNSPLTLQKQEVERITFDGVQVEVVPMEHVFTADDVDDERWEDRPVLVYRGSYTLSQLQRMVATQEGWTVTEEDLENEISDPTFDNQTAEQTVASVQADFEVLPDYLKPVECYLAFVKWRLEEAAEEEDLVVLVSKKSWKVLRVLRQLDIVDDNIKPIKRQRLFPKQGVSWGKPLYSASKGIQLCVDSLWNRCVNSADITITPWFFYRQSMAYEGKANLVISPGQGIPIPSVEDVIFPNLAQFNPVQFVPLIGQLITLWERTYNVSEYMQGMESSQTGKKGSTATGTLAVLQEGKIKHDYQGNRFKRQFESLLNLIFNLYKTNVTEERIQKTIGDQVSLFMLNQPYTLLLVSGDATTNRFIARQELESFVTGVQPFWDMFNPMFFAEQYSKEYKYDPKETIDPELNKIIQQYRMIKAEGMKLAQAMGIPEEQARNIVAELGLPADEIMKNADQVMNDLGKKNEENADRQPE